MTAVSSDDPYEPGSDYPDKFGQGQSAEEDDLAFLRDEGLELLALFKSIGEERKRRLIVEFIRMVAGNEAGG